MFIIYTTNTQYYASTLKFYWTGIELLHFRLVVSVFDNVSEQVVANRIHSAKTGYTVFYAKFFLETFSLPVTPAPATTVAGTFLPINRQPLE